jgi:hypothetical protein
MASKHAEVGATRYLSVEEMDSPRASEFGRMEAANGEFDILMDGANSAGTPLHPLQGSPSLLPELVQGPEVEDVALSQQFLSWEDVDRGEAADPARLAHEIQARYRPATRLQREATFVPDYPTLDDPTIWRVQVKACRVILVADH